MSDASARVGIVISAEDKTSPALKAASKGAERLRTRFEKLGPSIRKGIGALPDAAGKASAAMLLLQSSSSEMGAGVADAVNKIGAIVAMMAVGGPLGIALGATAAAVGILTTVWGAYKDRVDSVADALRGLERASKSLNGALREKLSIVTDLESELANMGLTSHEVRLADIRASITILQDNIPAMQKQLGVMSLLNRSRVLSGKITQAEADEQFRLDQIVLANAEKKLPLLKRELEALEMLEHSRKDAEAEEERRAQRDIERAASKAKRVAAQAEADAKVAAKKAKIEAARVSASAKIAAEITAIEAARATAGDELIANREKTRQAALARELSDARFLDEQRVSSAEETASALNGISDSLTRAVIDNDRDAARAAISSAIDVAQQKIVAYAASGAASAFEGSVKQFGPIAGPIFGAIAGAAVLAAILAFRSRINLAQGGVVTGGTPGRDSVPALLRPGERVLTPEQQRDGAIGGGGSLVIRNDFRMLIPDSTGARKMARIIDRELRKSREIGALGTA